MTVIKLSLKRENGKHFIHIPFNIFNAVLFPCPDFRRNIIINRSFKIFFYKFCNSQIKPRIINQYNHIRLKINYGFFAVIYISENHWSIFQYSPKTHKSHVTIVFHQFSSFCQHKVATQKAEFSI